MHYFRIHRYKKVLVIKNAIVVDKVFLYLLYAPAISKHPLTSECLAFVSLLLDCLGSTLHEITNEELLRYIVYSQWMTLILEFLSPRQVYFVICTMAIRMRYTGDIIQHILDKYPFTDIQLTWLHANKGYPSDFDTHPKVISALRRAK